ncbi:hypothetical protein CHUAL_008458 [Chamberlinius hualienensis]
MSLNDGTFRAIFVVIMLSSAWYYALIHNHFNLKSAIASKNVLITGASSGIGEQLAYHCSKLKANLVLTSDSRDKLLQVAENCKKLGAPKVEIFVADMTESKNRHHLIDTIRKSFNDKLDYLLLNHAMDSTSYWNGTEKNKTFLEQSFQANFMSYVDIASMSLPLLQHSNGHIGVVSSGCGHLGCPRLAHYSAAKLALHGFFSSWRQELQNAKISVSITLCILGSTSFETSDDYKQGLKRFLAPENVAVSTDDAATAILENVVERKYDMYYPKTLLLTVVLRHLFPKAIEDFFGKLALQGP